MLDINFNGRVNGDYTQVANRSARILLRFMKRRIKDAGRNVYLILDKLRVHHAKLVKAWLQRHQSEI